MTAIKAAIAILRESSGVTAIVKQKIFGINIPQKTESPCIKMQVISVDPSDTKDGPSELDAFRVQISCYGKDADQLNTLNGAIRTALDRYRGEIAEVNVEHIVYLNQVDGYDEMAEEYKIDTDYKFRIAY